MSSFVYNFAKGQLLLGNLPWVSGTYKVLLVQPGYTPNPDHQFVSDLGANEYSDSGYAAGFGGAGRQALTGKTITVDNTLDKAVADADDVTWNLLGTAGSGQTIAAAVIIKEGTSDADSVLIAYLDNIDFVTQGTDLTLRFNAAGLFRI